MGFFGDFKSIVKGTPQPSVSPTPQAPNPPQPLTSSKKILIVEDDEMLRDFYVELFTQQGYQVMQSINGQEGLNIVNSEKPDLIILDLNMPVMDGKTLLHILRAMPD